MQGHVGEGTSRGSRMYDPCGTLEARLMVCRRVSKDDLVRYAENQEGSGSGRTMLINSFGYISGVSSPNRSWNPRQFPLKESRRVLTTRDEASDWTMPAKF